MSNTLDRVFGLPAVNTWNVVPTSHVNWELCRTGLRLIFVHIAWIRHRRTFLFKNIHKIINDLTTLSLSPDFHFVTFLWIKNVCRKFLLILMLRLFYCVWMNCNEKNLFMYWTLPNYLVCGMYSMIYSLIMAESNWSISVFLFLFFSLYSKNCDIWNLHHVSINIWTFYSPSILLCEQTVC